MIDEERTPPEKVRITGLQEAFLPDLVQAEQAAAQMHWRVGLSRSEVQPRNDVAIALLPRTHDVLVAEADHEPAGYLAWADEAPGVACLKALIIAPAYQRFGIATRLLRELGEQATGHGLEHVVVACWDQAGWARSLLEKLGFTPAAADQLPDKIRRWQELREDELVQPGQRLWWRASKNLGMIPGLPVP